MTEQVTGHSVLGLVLAKAHVAPKIALLKLGTAAATAGLVAPIIVKKKMIIGKAALRAVHTKAKVGAFLLGAKKAALIKGAIIAKPLLVKGAVIAGKVHLFNTLRKKIVVPSYKHSYTHSYGKKKSYVHKSTGYSTGGVRSTGSQERTTPLVSPLSSFIPPIVPQINFPEVNVPVRFSLGGNGNGIMNNNVKNTNNDDIGFNSSLENNSASNTPSKQ
jgi:hypothetical protein